jgi:hypothetical protein
MSIGTQQSSSAERRIGLSLVAAAILCIVASGGLLWWRYGGAIFSSMVLSTLAWCF